jgi:ankyrin repeat protein
VDSFRDKLTIRDVKSALRNLPQGSDAYDVAYDAAMERIFTQGKGLRQKAQKILAWLLCARRPLSTHELLHALAVEPGDTEIDEDNILDTNQIFTICAGIVTIDEHGDNVRFIHYTTQEYLQRNQEMWLPYANVEIARVCTAYLSINDLAVGPCKSQEDYDRRLKKLILLDYAAMNWGHHMNLLLEAECMAGLDGAIHEAEAFMLNVECLSAASQVLFMSKRRSYVKGNIEEEGKGFSSSHWMARFGLRILLQQWISKRYDLNQCDFSGRTPLSFAAESGQEGTVKQLLDTCRVNIDSSDNNGRTPLSWAAWNGQEGVVKRLLDTRKIDVDSRDDNGQTSLSGAACNGQEGTVKQLLDTCRVNIDSSDNNGRTPLSWAAWNGQEGVVKQLLDTGKVDADSRDNSGRTPLSWAAWNGQERIVKQLLDTGKVDVDSRDGNGQTPLSWAAWRGKKAIVKQLLDTGKIDVDSRDNNGRTPLSWAAWRAKKAIVKQLLDTGKTDVDSRDNNGRTPLSWAAWNGREKIVKQLLDTGKVDIDSKDNNGRTPLSWAAQSGSKAAAILLLAKLLTRTGVEKSSNERVECTSVPITLDCFTDAFGRTPSMWAALGGNISLIQSLWPSHLPTTCSTISKGDSLGLSLIHLFAIGNCTKGISLVLRAGCNINEADSQGWTPLHWAAYFGHKEVLHLLIDRGADNTLEDSIGRTAYKISLFIGAEQLDGVLESPLTKDNEDTLMAGQEFSAFCDSCQRVSSLRLSRNHFFLDRVLTYSRHW